MAPQEPIDEAGLLRMRDSMTHRGPDDAGHWLTAHVALGSRRLAILDLSDRGHMPMSTSDGRYQIVYNGEVYNHPELRRMLQSRGHSFRSGTDTEVLLALFAEEGPAMLDRLNGMFALAIWDSLDQSLFLARDRFGIKPLYYAVDEQLLYFASEQKALFAAGLTPRFDPTTWEELLVFRYVAGSRTPLAGISRLLPGHWMRWRNGAVESCCWWSLSDRASAVRENLPADAIRWFGQTFDDSVSLRRVSDVPLGVLLSGGLDSSSVAASLSVHGGAGVSSFTMRFAESDYDEGPLARQVADRWGLAFHECRLSAEQLFSQLEHASWLNDEPLAHGNDVHLWAVSKFAKQHVTVLLSGEGSDELLGGYVRYQPLLHPWLIAGARRALPRIARVVPLRGRLEKLNRFIALGPLDNFVLFNSCDVLPADLRTIGFEPTGRFEYRENVLDAAKRLYPREPFRQAMYSDQHTFLCSLLDRNDRMTMGASIECRVPFLDYRLLETAAALPTHTLLSRWKSKHLLRASVGSRLPPAVLQARKWGFGVPWRSYMRDKSEFRELLDQLTRLEPIASGPFDLRKLRALIDEFFSGNDRGLLLLRQLAMVAIWHRAHFGRPSMTFGGAPVPSSALR